MEVQRIRKDDVTIKNSKWLGGRPGLVVMGDVSCT